MEYTERTPDEVIDRLHNAPCWECGGIGEVSVLPAGYPGVNMNNPYAHDEPCKACGGSGYQMEVWEVVS
ncbi:MAG TPA: hypothetical protein VIG24_01625 [Acidimicrobiia bacterium]